MATTPLKKAQTADLDQSIQIALDAADASMDVTAEFERISAQFAETATKAERLEKISRISLIAAGSIAVLAVVIMGMVWQRSSSGLQRLAATNTQLLTILTENVTAFEERMAPLAVMDKKVAGLSETLAGIQTSLETISVDASQMTDLRANVAQIILDLPGLETQEAAQIRAETINNTTADRIATLNGELAMSVSVATQDALAVQLDAYKALAADISEAVGAMDTGGGSAAAAELQEKLDARINEMNMRLNRVVEANTNATRRRAAPPQADVIKYP
jgi:type IV secretory pathway VirB2 component (pilin)